MNENESEIIALKNLLEQTDHIPNKIIEGLIDTLRETTPVTLLGDLAEYVKSVGDEYGDTIRKRAEWRKTINELKEADEPMDGPEVMDGMEAAQSEEEEKEMDMDWNT